MRNFPWLCILSVVFSQPESVGLCMRKRDRPSSCTNSATVLMIAKDFAANKSRDVTVNTLHSIFMIK